MELRHQYSRWRRSRYISLLMQHNKAMSGRDKQDTAGGVVENRGPRDCIFVRELNTNNLLQATIELFVHSSNDDESERY